jgi:hypothetical protein
MITSLITIISPQDYEAFRRILAPDLPDTHDEWLYLQKKERADQISKGHAIREIQAYPDKFIRFLKTSGQEANLQTLHNLCVSGGNRLSRISIRIGLRFRRNRFGPGNDIFRFRERLARGVGFLIRAFQSCRGLLLLGGRIVIGGARFHAEIEIGERPLGIGLRVLKSPDARDNALVGTQYLRERVGVDGRA